MELTTSLKVWCVAVAILGSASSFDASKVNAAVPSQLTYRAVDLGVYPGDAGSSGLKKGLENAIIRVSKRQ